MLQSLGLEGLHDRPAPLLSGGQQQRVALGRALVGDPDVLLLDEPFSNLDARRRDEMRFELKEVQARVGVTTIFITHDQSEAMVLSDRVVVMNAGRIVQEGTPQAIYQQPGTRFVMEFLGQVDQLGARVAMAPDGSPRARLDGADDIEIALDASHPWRPDDDSRADAALGGRPGARAEWIARMAGPRAVADLPRRTHRVCRGCWRGAGARLRPGHRTARRGRAGAARFSPGGNPRMAGGKTGREITGRKDDETEKARSWD